MIKGLVFRQVYFENLGERKGKVSTC